MKYLFIVQGDGRGHITQAIALSDMLRRNGHQVVEVLVGKSKSREIPDFFLRKIHAPVSSFDTPSFIFKKNKKHIHLIKTMLYNIHPKRIRKFGASIEAIHESIEKHRPDMVVNFYEMLAGLCHLRFRPQVPFVTIGHQFLINHPDFQYGKSDKKGMLAFRLVTLVCGIGAAKHLALSFYPMADCLPERIAVVPPLLRGEVLRSMPRSNGFILGYILNPGFEAEVRKWHKANPEVELHFFWDNKKAAKVTRVDVTLTFHTLDDELFLNFMACCRAYISTAGFESICEAFYLQKPVMVVPAHVEQKVNAKDASGTGLAIAGKTFDIGNLLQFAEEYRPREQFRNWTDKAEEMFLKHLESAV